MTATFEPEIGDTCTAHHGTFEGVYGEDSEGSWPICDEVDGGFEPDNGCTFERSADDDAWDRYDLGNRTLDELYQIRDSWALDAAELEAVNEAISDALNTEAEDKLRRAIDNQS